MKFDNECFFIFNKVINIDITFDNELEKIIYYYFTKNPLISYKLILNTHNNFSKLDIDRILTQYLKFRIITCIPKQAIETNTGELNIYFINSYRIYQYWYSQASIYLNNKNTNSQYPNEIDIEKSSIKILEMKNSLEASKLHQQFNDLPKIKAMIKEYPQEHFFMTPLLSLLQQRQSVRDYQPFNMPIADVQRLLYLTNSLFSNNHRAIGSGGDYYPVEIWGCLLSTDNTDLNEVIFYYNPISYILHFTKKVPNLRAILKNITYGHFGALNNASILLVLSMDIKYSSDKYKGPFSTHLATLEAGMVAQNIVLASIELNYHSLLIAGISGFEYIELFDLSYPVEFPVLAVTIGKKNTSG